MRTGRRFAKPLADEAASNDMRDGARGGNGEGGGTAAGEDIDDGIIERLTAEPLRATGAPPLGRAAAALLTDGALLPPRCAREDPPCPPPALRHPSPLLSHQVTTLLPQMHQTHSRSVTSREDTTTRLSSAAVSSFSLHP